MRPKSDLTPRDLWKETLGLYALMTLLTLVVGWIQGSIALIAGYGALISALAFIYLPTEVLLRRGEDVQSFGIGAGTISRSILLALKMSLIILPIYTIAYHFWQETQGYQPHIDTQSLSRWGEDLRGRPMTPISAGEVRLFAERNQLTIQWALLTGEKTLQLKLDGWQQAKVRARSRQVKIQKIPQESLLITGQQQGSITLSSPLMELNYQVRLDGKPLSSERLKLGALLKPGKSEGSQQRDWWWIILTLATQLLLVAIPEELFYRGYVQGRLDELVGKDRSFLGVQVNLHSILITSILFALAHLATIHHPARLAVFFPSLLFGWMRRAYGNTLTPAIFHAICNLTSQVLWGFYVPI